MEVRDNVLTIIADTAENERDIDASCERAKQRAEARIQEAREKRDDQFGVAEVALHKAWIVLKFQNTVKFTRLKGLCQIILVHLFKSILKFEIKMNTLFLKVITTKIIRRILSILTKRER